MGRRGSDRAETRGKRSHKVQDHFLTRFRLPQLPPSRLMGRWGDGISCLSWLSLSLSSTKAAFWLHTKPWGVFFGGGKSPCGNGDTHSLVLEHRNDCVPHEKHSFQLQKNLGVLFLGRKKPLRSWGRALPSLQGGPVSNLGPVSNPVPPGCVVRVPAHWAI